MKQRLLLLLSLGYCTLSQSLFLQAAKAQVTPDGTTNTTVDVSGNDFTIEQGNRAGGNLFHSFSDFSVPNGGSAFFNNAADIVNIFSRVTGGNISNIDGLLGANGTANLFLINPAGIIFGEGARLDIGGSFYGSTADSIVFSDGEFSASNLANPPLITINAPIGLNFRDNPGDIVNRSVADGVGLRVPHEEKIILVGGGLNLEGGRITAPGGKVDLGGLSAAGTVTFNDDSSLSFPEEVAKANITLNHAATVNVTSTGGGSIIINARNLNLEGGNSGQSNIRAGTIVNSTSTVGDSGDITINATENVTIDNSSISNQVNLRAVGDSGDVIINTGSLSLTNGGQVSASTFGQGNAGSLQINAHDSILIDGENSNGFSSRILSLVNRGAIGDSGNVIINTGSLSLTNGGQASASTFGQGNAGSVQINANDNIMIDGEDSNGFSSRVTSQVARRSVGNAGNITITTKSLSLNNGGQVSTTTFGQGNAGSLQINAHDNIMIDGEDSNGISSRVTSQVARPSVGNASNITITTRSLSLSDGGRVSASTFGQGNSEDIMIETDSLIMTSGGTISAVTLSEGNAGNITVKSKDLISISGFNNDNRSGFFTNAILKNGNGGDINLFTNQLNIDNSGTIEASNFDSFPRLIPFESGTGKPGNINIEANSLSLNNGARIDVDSQSNIGNSANINLKILDKITLGNDSFISARAFERANGGNIDIVTNFIVAFPHQNNDIFASAEQGRGGNINITAEALFGIEERPSNPITNDINASSEFGLDGTISIITPDVNPLQRDAKVPSNLIAPEQTIAQACQKNRNFEQPNGLTLKGKGGIPPVPTEPFDSYTILVDEPITIANIQAKYPEIKPIKTNMGDIYPARGIVKTAEGKIILTAYATDNLNNRTPNISADCSSVSQQ
ncbi:MAG: filamentous hemagglutinin N-terminal domain-containing protein [Xenococcus sp. (in: cyanobacteria)]